MQDPVTGRAYPPRAEAQKKSNDFNGRGEPICPVAAVPVEIWVKEAPRLAAPARVQPYSAWPPLARLLLLRHRTLGARLLGRGELESRSAGGQAMGPMVASTSQNDWTKDWTNAPLEVGPTR